MYNLKLGVAFVQYTQWPHCFCINTVSVFAISLASQTPTQMAFRVPCVILKVIHGGVGWVWLACKTMFAMYFVLYRGALL